MAKRPAEDEEDDAPKIRKRRRPKTKPEDDEDEGAGRPPGKKGRVDDDDEEDENLLPSSGIVLLDIALDFRDDCVDWAKEHFLYAVIIAAVSFIIFVTVSSLTIHSWVRYLNRPTLQSVLRTYDIGAYPDAKLYADEALVFTSRNDFITRAGLAFVQGASNVMLGDKVPEIDKRPYYLAAADYLRQSVQYGFVAGRVDEGYFLLGKALYFCEELVECRLPLEAALDKETPHRKMILWYLANAYLFGLPPDLELARAYLQLFQNEPTVLEEELAESYLLTAMIEIQDGNLEEAEKSYRRVPHFERFAVMRSFVAGEIEFFNARLLRKKAIEIESNPNPITPEELPAAPAPVKKLTGTERFGNVIESSAAHGALPKIRGLAPVGKINMPELTSNSVIESRMENQSDLSKPAVLAPVTDGYSKRLAVLQTRYIADGDKVIVLPKEEKKPDSPLPPELVKEIIPYVDPVHQRINEFYTAAAEQYENAVEHFTFVIQQTFENLRYTRQAILLAGIATDERNHCLSKTGGKIKRLGSEYFNNLIETYPFSPETAAASFILGEQDRKAGKTEVADRNFSRTFSILRKTPGYHNVWLPKETMVANTLEYIRRDIERQEHTEAVALLKIVRGVIPNEEEARLRGETYEDWARQLQSRSEAVFGESGNKLAKEANEKWRLAGKAFDDHAEILAGSPLYDDNLWRSAEDYRTGNDYQNAVLEYKKYQKANYIDNRPELFLYLGEMYLNLDALELSAEVLQDVLKDFPAHHLTPSIRLVLSRTYLELYRLNQEPKDETFKDYGAEAKKLLQQNLAGEFEPVSAIFRDTLYALGQLCFHRHERPEAEAYLEDAVKIHPEAVQAADGHYVLAMCYQQDADAELAKLDELSTAAFRDLANDNAADSRQRALTHLQDTVKILSARRQGLGLTDAETLMLRNAQFGAGTLLIKMEQYQEAVPVLNRTATQYQDRPEALDALISLAFALRKTGKKQDAVSILNRAEVLLNRLTQNGTIPNGENWKNIIAKEKLK